MNEESLHSIGDLARRTGLPVKTIRFYSDRGLVPPTGRSPVGYRLYGSAAVARVNLVRTLRELDLDLSTIRQVLNREASLPEVAAAYADALAVQIQVLRQRRAVLTVAAKQKAPAVAAGIDPASPGADPIAAAISAGSGTPELRRRLVARLEAANDPRRERYLRLLSVVNGWAATESAKPALDWAIRALRARTPVVVEP